MRPYRFLLCCLAATLTTGTTVSLSAEASIKTERTGGLKNKSTVALGAFRVIFVTQDSIGAQSTNNARGSGFFGVGQANNEQSARLVGLEKTTMQRLTDQIYADFLGKLKAQGYTVAESGTIAASVPQYKDLDMTENFQSGRWGTYVVPTGQQSMALAADESKEVGRGSKGGVFSGFKNQGQRMKKGEVDQVAPQISKAMNDAPVLGVTVVVSFAKFKGSGYSHWGQSARTKIETGATINGMEQADEPMATGVQVWDAHMYDNCKIACPLSTLALKGDIHDEHTLGEMVKTKDRKDLDTLTGSAEKSAAWTLILNPDAYQKNVSEVATNAVDLMTAAIAKEK